MKHMLQSSSHFLDGPILKLLVKNGEFALVCLRFRKKTLGYHAFKIEILLKLLKRYSVSYQHVSSSEGANFATVKYENIV